MTPNDDNICSREEVLELLSQKARDGQTGAMIALERALRAKKKEDDEVDEAITRILEET